VSDRLKYTNPGFMPCLKALSECATGDLTLAELVTLTKAIFQETMKEDDTLGGDVRWL
jgi:hypothetical protein